MSQCTSKPGILSLVPEYQSSYIPKSSLPTFPKPLQDLYDPMLLNISYPELLTKCESCCIELSEEMACNVEEATRAQSDSRLWFQYRAGRVTASRMKQVCRTSLATPSQYLVKEICYPESFCFATSATCWGRDHEKVVCERYAEIMAEKHEQFSVVNSGLVLNPQWPHLGASPDGIITCVCCGRGVLEIKCPYSHRNSKVEDVATDTHSCLKKSDTDHCLHLDHDHAYYFQVQAQIFVCQVEYADFCVCTFPSGSAPQMHIERIYPNNELWQICIERSTHFFQRCILPELLGRWNSTGPCIMAAIATGSSQALISDNDPAPSDVPQLIYCYCQQPEGTSEIIGCDNPECSIEWFHTNCLKLKDIPKGKWYCPDCCKLPQFTRRRMKKE